MPETSEPLIHEIEDEPDRYTFWCPGCECGHWFQTSGGPKEPVWTFNGDRFDQPTVRPSIITKGGKHGSNHVCHFFIESGKIRFLNDCTHKLKGQTVPMEPFP